MIVGCTIMSLSPGFLQNFIDPQLQNSLNLNDLKLQRDWSKVTHQVIIIIVMIIVVMIVIIVIMLMMMMMMMMMIIIIIIIIMIIIIIIRRRCGSCASSRAGSS